MSYTVGMTRSETPREDRGSVRQSINIEMFKAMERKTSHGLQRRPSTILSSLLLPFGFPIAIAPFHTERLRLVLDLLPDLQMLCPKGMGCFSILIQRNVKYKTG